VDQPFQPGVVPDHQHTFDVVAHLVAPFEPGLPTGAVELVVDGDLNVVGKCRPHPIERGDGAHRGGAQHHLDGGSTFLERTSQPWQGLVATARQGPLVNGGQGLVDVPMLNLGIYQDTVELGADYHDRFRDFSVRARLLRENGHFDNHVMWHAHPAAIPADFADLQRLLVMDNWVTAIGDDRRDVPKAQKVVDNRPSGLTDRCTLADRSHHTMTQSCIAGLPPAGDPRIAAGGPIANDVLKCQTKALNFADYGVTFTEDQQQQRLRDVFPHGVCDWTKPGVAQQSPMAPWLSFDTPALPVPLG
jgi:hypothetical protein